MLFGRLCFHCFDTVWYGHVSRKDKTSSYATWFTAGVAIRIAHYDVTDDVITREL